MKFKDLVTRNVLETDNEDVIQQFRLYSERYVEVKEEKTVKPKKSVEQE